jgi:hypothetical protein
MKSESLKESKPTPQKSRFAPQKLQLTDSRISERPIEMEESPMERLDQSMKFSNDLKRPINYAPSIIDIDNSPETIKEECYKSPTNKHS